MSEEGVELMCLCDLSESDAETGDEEVWPAAEACVHHHGQVFSITALCQSCHADRSLEVV